VEKENTEAAHLPSSELHDLRGADRVRLEDSEGAWKREKSDAIVSFVEAWSDRVVK
jgi:hypothetical protein